MFSRLPHLRNDIFTLVPPRFFFVFSKISDFTEFTEKLLSRFPAAESIWTVGTIAVEIGRWGWCWPQWQVAQCYPPVNHGWKITNGCGISQPWLPEGHVFLMFVFKTIFQMKSLKKDMRVLTCAQFWLLFGKAADLYLPQSWIWLGPNCECKEDFSK